MKSDREKADKEEEKSIYTLTVSYAAAANSGSK